MKKALATVTAGAMLLSVTATTASAASQIDSHSDYVMASYDSTDDWRIVDSVSDVYGEDYATASDSSDTLSTRFSASFELNYDDYRSSWGTTYIPSSKNHRIKIEKGVSTPSPIWTPEVIYTYDNTKDGSTMSPYTEYALDWLWSLAGAYTKLTLPPGPWKLINNPTGVKIDPVANSGVQVTYNSDPTVMAVEYRVEPQKPFQEGYYSIAIRSYADAGLMMSTPYYYSSPSDDMTTTQALQNNGRTAPGAEMNDTLSTLTTGPQKTLTLNKGTEVGGDYEKVVVANEPVNQKQSRTTQMTSTEGTVGTEAYTWIDEGTISMINYGSFTVDIVN